MFPFIYIAAGTLHLLDHTVCFQIYVMNGLVQSEMLAHRVSGYYTSSQSSLNELDTGQYLELYVLYCALKFACVTNGKFLMQLIIHLALLKRAAHITLR